ncbi:MAG: ABC transporter ATP-binding protein [Vulcanimicrobiota bacterium]
MLGLLKPYRGLVGLLLALSVLSNATGLLLPRLIGTGINRYEATGALPPAVFEQFLVAVVAIAILATAQTVVEVLTSERVARDLRQRLADRLSRQSYTFVVERDPAQLLTNLTSDIDSIKFFVSQAISGILSSGVILVGASLLLLSLEWRLGLVIIAIIPLIGIVFGWIFSKVRQLFREGREVVDRLNRVIGQSIIGAGLIRVLAATGAEKEKFAEVNRQARDLGLSVLRHFASMIPVVVFLSNLGTFAILTLGGRFVVADEMSLGTIAAFTTYLGLLIFPVIMLGFMGNLIAQAQASYGRVVEVLEAADPEPTGTITAGLKGLTEVKAVHLSYGEKEVLKGVSLKLEPGTRNAVVGPTAAGKSQLVNLLSGLLEPSQGQVVYDGQYAPRQLRHQVSVVFQESSLFAASLRENICFYPNTTAESYELAVRTAELHDFLEGLPQGDATPVSERGSSLSGGQKQRVMLARALAKAPDVLLLDDFTARLDPTTEASVLANLRRNYPGLTLLTVTQRIAPIVDYDQIFLMMEGEILARGTHQQLLATSPEYLQIYESQKSTHALE